MAEIGSGRPVALLELLAAGQGVDEVIGGIAAGGGFLDRTRVEDVALDHFDPVAPRLEVEVLG